ncbi:methylamine dehydrogenase light chain precursor [Gluconacetobacter azotocaptans DSM 13594]|nr:methylamine dehydrogenase light chain precursor [Gluconacetobacter azotocaptans DSM 13594]
MAQMFDGRLFEGWSEKLTRRLASGTSRRGVLSRVGLALAAAPVFPLLPVDRSRAHAATTPRLTEFQKNAQVTDDTRCNYWRYCAIDGSLCSCCGGGVHSCPPGTQPSLTSWVGTCYNPADKRSYLIAYRDCCGTSSCRQCHCDNTDGALPTYRPQANNEIIWCFGTSSMAYHCSTAALVGVAE